MEVVDMRLMGGEDVAISPTTCLCIWTQLAIDSHAAGVVGGGGGEEEVTMAMTGALLTVLMKYSTVILVVEQTGDVSPSLGPNQPARDNKEGNRPSSSLKVLWLAVSRVREDGLTSPLTLPPFLFSSSSI